MRFTATNHAAVSGPTSATIPTSKAAHKNNKVPLALWVSDSNNKTTTTATATTVSAPSARRQHSQVPTTLSEMENDDGEVGPTSRRLPPGMTLADLVRQNNNTNHTPPPPTATTMTSTATAFPALPSGGGLRTPTGMERGMMNRSTLSSGSSTDVPMATRRGPRSHHRPQPGWSPPSSSYDNNYSSEFATPLPPPWETPQEQEWRDEFQSFSPPPPPPSYQSVLLDPESNQPPSSPQQYEHCPLPQQGCWKAYQQGGASWRYSPYTLIVVLSEDLLHSVPLSDTTTEHQVDQCWKAESDFHLYHSVLCFQQPAGSHNASSAYLDEGAQHHQLMPNHRLLSEEGEETHDHSSTAAAAVPYTGEMEENGEVVVNLGEPEGAGEAAVVGMETSDSPPSGTEDRSPLARSMSPLVLGLEASQSGPAPPTAIPSPTDVSLMYTPVLLTNDQVEPATLPTTPRRASTSSPLGYSPLSATLTEATPLRNPSFNETPPTLRRRPPAGYIGAARTALAPDPPSPIQFDESNTTTPPNNKKKGESCGQPSTSKKKVLKSGGATPTKGKPNVSAAGQKQKTAHKPVVDSPAKNKKKASPSAGEKTPSKKGSLKKNRKAGVKA